MAVRNCFYYAISDNNMRDLQKILVLFQFYFNKLREVYFEIV
jgi:hypothetical protein